MLEKEVIVTTKYGRIPTFAACPEEPGKFPGVILYMDAPGMREELRNLGRRIAKNGYYCIVPDMYYRMGTLRFDIPRRNPAMSAVIAAAKHHLTNEMVTDDTAGLIAWLDGQEKAAPGPVGCIGYCMSGCFVTTVAARFPDRMLGAASLYGLGIVTDQPDSPHLLVDRIKGEIYFGFAEHDPEVGPDVIPTLKQSLDEAGTRYEIETIPNVHHGFQSPERPHYDSVGAEYAWKKVFDLWDRTLRS